MSDFGHSQRERAAVQVNDHRPGPRGPPTAGQRLRPRGVRSPSSAREEPGSKAEEEPDSKAERNQAARSRRNQAAKPRRNRTRQEGR